MDSVCTDFFCGPTRTNGRSNMRSTASMRNSTATTSAGLTTGIVIFQNDRQAPEPSILAASYTSAGMTCRPASTRSPMKGAVFQVSAITTESHDWSPSVLHSTFLPMMSLAMPSAAKIHRQSRAEIAVGMAHGTRMLARTRPRPRNARFMTSAMQTPTVVSMATVTTVNDVVFQKAFQTSLPVSPLKMSVKFCADTVVLWTISPVAGSMSYKVLTNERRRADTMGYPITRPSTSSDGESRIAASRPTPTRRPGADPRGLPLSTGGASTEVVWATAGPPCAWG